MLGRYAGGQALGGAQHGVDDLGARRVAANQHGIGVGAIGRHRGSVQPHRAAGRQGVEQARAGDHAGPVIALHADCASLQGDFAARHIRIDARRLRPVSPQRHLPQCHLAVLAGVHRGNAIERRMRGQRRPGKRWRRRRESRAHVHVDRTAGDGNGAAVGNERGPEDALQRRVDDARLAALRGPDQADARRFAAQHAAAHAQAAAGVRDRHRLHPFPARHGDAIQLQRAAAPYHCGNAALGGIDGRAGQRQRAAGAADTHPDGRLAHRVLVLHRDVDVLERGGRRLAELVGIVVEIDADAVVKDCNERVVPVVELSFLPGVLRMRRAGHGRLRRLRRRGRQPGHAGQRQSCGQRMQAPRGTRDLQGRRTLTESIEIHVPPKEKLNKPTRLPYDAGDAKETTASRRDQARAMRGFAQYPKPTS
ncbi:Uncharacterised protein [Bordetella pertussis]|nr:hypothetical protein L551_0622 [Bordetella pertussis STO1-SEAT-0004]CFM97815.1 Uncharacterised protein [Bordetella pertussis]CPL10639.1 Uncharacterised protein [Bordetella pertussis]CPL72611.1 Uncharacterised protein [Bordetella pertussis]CPN40798.1 Uncharacterised protein [Bordetella pertussis]